LPQPGGDDEIAVVIGFCLACSTAFVCSRSGDKRILGELMIDHRREYASAVACQIINLLAGDYPGGKAELYGMIHRLHVNLLSLACEEQSERWKTPSQN
jgi:hypothetical protein